MAVVMSRVEESRPPAVSSSMISAAALCRSASWMASSISSAETGWIADLTRTSRTSPAFGAEEASGASRPIKARARRARAKGGGRAGGGGRGWGRRYVVGVEYWGGGGGAPPGGVVFWIGGFFPPGAGAG